MESYGNMNSSNGRQYRNQMNQGCRSCDRGMQSRRGQMMSNYGRQMNRESERQMMQNCDRQMKRESERQMMQNCDQRMKRECEKQEEKNCECQMNQRNERQMMQERERKMMQERERKMMQERERQMMQERERQMMQERERQMMHNDRNRTVEVECSCKENEKKDCHRHDEMEKLGCNFPVVMSYVPWQQWGELYDAEYGLKQGTIFKDLNFIFCGERW